MQYRRLHRRWLRKILLRQRAPCAWPRGKPSGSAGLNTDARIYAVMRVLEATEDCPRPRKGDGLAQGLKHR